MSTSGNIDAPGYFKQPYLLTRTELGGKQTCLLHLKMVQKDLNDNISPSGIIWRDLFMRILKIKHADLSIQSKDQNNHLGNDTFDFIESYLYIGSQWSRMIPVYLEQSFKGFFIMNLDVNEYWWLLTTQSCFHWWPVELILGLSHQNDIKKF